jgi:putative serine protease PepD
VDTVAPPASIPGQNTGYGYRPPPQYRPPDTNGYHEPTRGEQGYGSEPGYGPGPAYPHSPAHPQRPAFGERPAYAERPAFAERPAYQPPSMQPAQKRRRWPLAVTFVLVLLLGAAAAYQTVRLNRIEDRLAANEKVLVETQNRDNTRLDGLDGRAAEIEKQLGNAFNPEAISAAALPSVFRVTAGNAGGTAFAVGKPASGGGTNLFTNWHVVEEHYNGGGRKVTLERKDDTYEATIVKVDRDNDVAQLRTTTKVTGLVTAKGEVKSGQQIVVVGAPLGLTDSVTTGVVSAVRKIEDAQSPMIQFSAPINPGNSGGPVINSAKQVVGIATAKAVDAEGIGLAVPITVACREFKIC